MLENATADGSKGYEKASSCELCASYEKIRNANIKDVPTWYVHWHLNKCTVTAAMENMFQCQFTKAEWF